MKSTNHDVLIENTRTPFTDIAKRLTVSTGLVHVRVKMEESGIIHGSSLSQWNYRQLGTSPTIGFI
jgi:Lrp/AsnC family transcriptional regulator for asnA, asnC and gidA